MPGEDILRSQRTHLETNLHKSVIHFEIQYSTLDMVYTFGKSDINKDIKMVEMTF